MLLARMYYKIGNMSIPTRITFTHVKEVLRNAGKVNRPPLGRWSLKHCQNSGLIVDYANEDHCGTCSEEDSKTNKNSKFTKSECC